MEIFLVESFPHTRQRLAEVLATIPRAHIAGHAESARAAIAAILETKPDVVVLGLKLDEGSAFDVLREVHPREPGIDFYVLSNFASEPYERYAERLGALAFFDKNEGLEAVREAIVRRAAVPH
jgi:DNA-binding NarL/FixJ family response regulator